MECQHLFSRKSFLLNSLEVVTVGDKENLLKRLRREFDELKILSTVSKLPTVLN